MLKSSPKSLGTSGVLWCVGLVCDPYPSEFNYIFIDYKLYVINLSTLCISSYLNLTKNGQEQKPKY